MDPRLNYKYLVATRCFTYNHAPYIQDALNGFALQNTNFPCVFIVVDDASKDEEPNVIRKWVADNLISEEGKDVWKGMPFGKLAVAPLKEKTNSLFVVLLLTENHYQSGIGLKRFDYIAEWLDNSKYHAICEGDDYWTYENKLQEQVDYLESHPTCSLVHSKALVYESYSKHLTSQTKGRSFESFNELLLSNKVVSLTVCIRNSSYYEYLEHSAMWEEKKKWKMGDYPCWLWLSKNYDVHFFDTCMGVYRVLPESASHSRSVQKAIAFIDSNYQIQLFFASHYSVSNSFRKELQISHIENRIRTYCHFKCFHEAYLETRKLKGWKRMKYILLVFMKSIKKK